jgi:hypothetical protein
MRRMLILAAAAALWLLAAPAAVAKEITKAEVCGSGGNCAVVDDEQGRMALMSGGNPTDPPRAAPYYEVRAEMSHGDEHATITFVTVPSRRAVRYDDGMWYAMTAEQVALIQKLTTDMKALPAAGLVGAAEPPEPQPAPAATDDGGSLLWPEGVLLALALGVAGVFLVRSPRRFLPARFAGGEGSGG